MESTRAILLRKTRFSDTSLILTWLTEHHGKVRTMAKGARQAKSRFAGRIDLFFECEIGFLRSRKSELHGLREVALLEPHEGLRGDYRRVQLAAYFAELMEMVTEPEHLDLEIYDLMRRGLRHLNEQPATLRALEHFERELVRIQGIELPEANGSKALLQVYHRLPGARTVLARDLPFIQKTVASETDG